MAWLPSGSTIQNRIIAKIVLDNPEISTGELYDKYCKEMEKQGLKPVTQRSLNKRCNILIEEDWMDGRVHSAGKYGRTTLHFPNENTQKLAKNYVRL